MQKKNPKKSAKKAQKPAKKKKAKPPKEKKLTPRDKLFAIEYLADLNLNPERAAKKVGYSDTVARTKAYQWVSDSKHKPLLFKRIKDLIDKRSKKTEITAEYVLGNLKEIGERCMQRAPVMVKVGKKWEQKTEFCEETGKFEGVWEFREMGALKANELMGKHMKLFTEKIEERVTERTVFVTEKDQVEADSHIDESLNK